MAYLATTFLALLFSPFQDPNASLEIADAPLLPTAISSFGAARSGDWVYVYGGHVGRAHAHSRENVIGEFRRWSVVDGGEFQSLPGGEPLQGTTLVAHGGAVYRIGGVRAFNAPDEPDDMRSTDSVQRFDTTSNAWTTVTPLPEPRSSHDACVIGDAIVVAGGWKLDGTTEPVWHKTAWKADLSEEPLVWRRLPDLPFPRRALALAPLGNRVSVVGGITESGEFTPSLLFLDSSGGSWESGPDLPMEGFGVAAVELDGSLVTSAMDGRILRLGSQSNEWEDVGHLALPRIFHRLVVDGPHALIAIGGAGLGTHLRLSERARLDDIATLQRIDVAIPSLARDRQAVFLNEGRLDFVGGNLGRGQHAFEPDDFVSDAFSVSIGKVLAEAWTPLPVARQSMGTVSLAGRHFVLGGFGHDGQDARAHDAIFELDEDTKSWKEHALRLPLPRTQFQVVEHEGRGYVFGGADYDPRGEEGGEFHFASEVVCLDLGEESIRDPGIRIPRPRRAFASAKVGSKVYLIGGLSEQFEPIAECDVFDFATGAWSEAPASATPRIGAQAVVLNGRIWLAGGSSNSESGRFDSNTSLEVFDPVAGWRTAVAELPFSARQMELFEFGEHLLFVTTHSEVERMATIWLMKPPLVTVGIAIEAAATR